MDGPYLTGASPNGASPEWAALEKKKAHEKLCYGFEGAKPEEGKNKKSWLAPMTRFRMSFFM